MHPLLLRRSLQVVTGVALGLAVVSVVYFGLPGLPGSAAPDPTPFADPAVPEPFPVPSFSLATSSGAPFDEERLQGKVSVVFFGFANCPDVCPLTLGNLGQALERLETEGQSFQGVFVTVDPRRDTPEALAEFMSDFHPELVALTGSEGEIQELTDRWGVEVAFQSTSGSAGAMAGGNHAEHTGHGADPEVARPAEASPPPDNEEYSVGHSTRAFVVDEEGWVVRSLAAYLTPEEILAALRPLLQ